MASATEPMTISPPETATAQSVGFKEWALVCAALAAGRQSLILRKGGIAEGRDGFRFKHESFFLFPTQYHQQAAKTRPGEADVLEILPLAAAGEVRIELFFASDWAVWIDDWETIRRLEPFHIWREEAIRERFDYDDAPGLQCAFGRVYRLEPAWTFPDKPGYGGCRSWVSFPELPAGVLLAPALTDEIHRRRAAEVRAALGDGINFQP